MRRRVSERVQEGRSETRVCEKRKEKVRDCAEGHLPLALAKLRMCSLFYELGSVEYRVESVRSNASSESWLFECWRCHDVDSLQ